MPMTFRYPNLITLDGVDLTDESRQPLSEERDERSVVVDLASGKKRKFIKGIRRKWSVSWENVAMNATNTLDGLGGRNEIRAIADSGNTVAFVITDGRNAVETYTVFVESYSEEPVMRLGPGDLFRYKISMDLLEQG